LPFDSYYGNLEVGKDLTVEQLKDLYHIIIFAYGASEDRKLGIPGEVCYLLPQHSLMVMMAGTVENRAEQ